MAKRYVRLTDPTKSLSDKGWKVSGTAVVEITDPPSGRIDGWLRSGALQEVSKSGKPTSEEEKLKFYPPATTLGVTGGVPVHPDVRQAREATDRPPTKDTSMSPAPSPEVREAVMAAEGVSESKASGSKSSKSKD